MIQIDLPLTVRVGSLFADVAQRQLQLGRAAYCFNAAGRSNCFQILCFSWIPIYYMTEYFGRGTTHMWWKADSALREW
jgi:hypothetical protein